MERIILKLSSLSVKNYSKVCFFELVFVLQGAASFSNSTARLARLSDQSTTVPGSTLDAILAASLLMSYILSAQLSGFLARSAKLLNMLRDTLS